MWPLPVSTSGGDGAHSAEGTPEGVMSALNLQAPSPWDPADDLHVEHLVSAAQWSAGQVARARVLYDQLTQAPGPGAAATMLVELGVPAHLSAAYERAMVRHAGPMTFDEFVVALIAMDPLTAHGGVWNGLRAQYIFRT